MTEYYQRKLYAFLQSSLPHPNDPLPEPFRQLACWSNLRDLRDWWEQARIVRDVAASSDRINLQTTDNLSADVEVRHPISGQRQTITELAEAIKIPPEIRSSTDAKQVFWWFWRFYPEYLAQANSQALLYPAHRILPDCPLHSHQSTVSALAGAMYPYGAGSDSEPQTPYLLLFSFSPVQEFIKASRKFLDFWAGSYLLHYLSARLCWYIAKEYGPDEIVVPSLWGQDIIDAFWIQQYRAESINGEDNPDYSPEFDKILAESFDAINDGLEPVERFDPENHIKDKRSNSLSTAGFPNMITVLVPGKEAAQDLGQKLTQQLRAEWEAMGQQIKTHVRAEVIQFLTDPQKAQARQEFWREFDKTLPKNADPEIYRREAELLTQASNWEWTHLWNAQLSHTWEPYWAAVPLGNPDRSLKIEAQAANYSTWVTDQDAIAWPPTELPSQAETGIYAQLNVGTWWGSLQQRLRTAHMAVKNTRHWQIPAAPGPRSSLSGQFSAIHPRLNYQKLKRNGSYKDFREGGGLPESSMRLFWLLMSYAYKGLFNGSEMLNALELTKRMAWQFGGVAESMGINVEKEKESSHLEEQDRRELGIDDETEIDYEKLIRFPNLSSIAAARFMFESAHQDSSRLKNYWVSLRRKIRQSFPQQEQRQQRNAFGARTRGRPTQVAKTDSRINPENLDGRDYNGVMFSAKWLADEMNLEKSKPGDTSTNEVALLRQAVDAAHKAADFGDGSPGDWWVIVLGDGDGMGRYISGERLHAYRRYISASAIDRSNLDKETHQTERNHLASLLKKTQKRMGPATHIGLNRALLDFSNRLVPYLTEKRYCGRVIYSGGDDVMAVLPLEDLPGYLRSLRAAWSGHRDPYLDIDPKTHDDPVKWFEASGGYWQPKFREGQTSSALPDRPHFTMGGGATMSLGIVIANKAVPLPTVLESLWDAEKTAKAMPRKDGLCFRVIYGGGNTLEALMKGSLLDDWWQLIANGMQLKDSSDSDNLSPVLYRLAEELPRRACITPSHYLFAEAAKVIVDSRDDSRRGGEAEFKQFCHSLNLWLSRWEDWARDSQEQSRASVLGQPKSELEAEAIAKATLGTRPEDLGYLLRFSAFWASKKFQRQAWLEPVKQGVPR